MNVFLHPEKKRKSLTFKQQSGRVKVRYRAGKMSFLDKETNPPSHFLHEYTKKRKISRGCYTSQKLFLAFPQFG